MMSFFLLIIIIFFVVSFHLIFFIHSIIQVRVPAPFSVNISNLQPSPNLLPQQQLPPNINQLPQPTQNQYTPIQIIVPPNGQNSSQSALRLSTLNSVLIAGPQDNRGIPSSLLNSFLQRTQNQLQSQSAQLQPQQQPIPTRPQQQSHHQISKFFGIG